MNPTPTLTPTKLKQRIIRKKIYAKLIEMSTDEADFQKNYETYNRLMNNSVEKIKEYLHQHNKQYWNGSKKRYQVLYLMKLNNEMN
tara:strand:+ start:1086 stop:1343 length:258 start_codon:yes stop_codon:yes gene_type:complete